MTESAHITSFSLKNTQLNWYHATLQNATLQKATSQNAILQNATLQNAILQNFLTNGYELLQKNWVSAI